MVLLAQLLFHPRKRLLSRHSRAVAAVVQRMDGDSGRSGRRERQLLLHDVVPAQGNDEEDAKEPSARGERDEPADVLLWQLRQESEPVHRRDGADEQNADATRGCARVQSIGVKRREGAYAIE